jgi:tetratricopeptide (TPR) repeat protein
VSYCPLGRQTWILLLFLCGAVPAALDNSAKLFEHSATLYRDQQYDHALSALRELFRDDGAPSRYASRAGLLLTRTYSQLGRFDEARQTAQECLIRFPSSHYSDWFHFELARISCQTDDGRQARSHLLWILEHSAHATMVSVCEDRLTAMVHAGIEESVLLEMQENLRTDRAKAWLKLWTVRYYYGIGKKERGYALLQGMKRADLSEKQFTTLQDWQSLPEEKLRYPLRIGLILPLSGEYDNEGRQFLSGFLLALKERRDPVELVLKDSKGSLAEACRVMNEMLNSNVSIIVGELDGDRSTALAALAAQAGKLFLSPVATNNGIAGLGKRIFQMNSNIETRGQALARYAIEKLGLQTFATLAPADEYGQALTDAFTVAVDRLGGAIIAQQWYYPGTEDFKRHFQTIRESALRSSPPDTAEINHLYRKKKEMAEAGQRVLGSQDDLFELPVKSIDGFFFPIYEEDLPIIAPQFALVNIQSLPLGGDNWNHLETLSGQRRYVNGAVFFSGQYLDDTDAAYIQFKNQYRLATLQSPTVLSVIGYDLAHQLQAMYVSGNAWTACPAAYFEQAPVFKGLAGDYRFSADSRVNRSVHILQYQNGNIVKLEN